VTSGQFYQSITPLATGGQPVQLYYMVKKDSIPFWAASSAVFNRLFLYKIVLVLYGFAGAGFLWTYLTGVLEKTIAFTVAGLVLSFLIAAGALFLFFRPGKLTSIVSAGLSSIHRVYPPSADKLKKEKLEELFGEYTRAVEVLVREKKLFLMVAGLMFLNLTLQFSSAYFVYRALGFNSMSPLFFLGMQAVLRVTIFYIPTPGNLGAAEYGFYLFYSGLYNGTTLMAAVLLWRFITYYYKLLVCAPTALWTYWRQHLGGTAPEIPVRKRFRELFSSDQT